LPIIYPHKSIVLAIFYSQKPSILFLYIFIFYSIFFILLSFILYISFKTLYIYITFIYFCNLFSGFYKILVAVNQTAQTISVSSYRLPPAPTLNDVLNSRVGQKVYQTSNEYQQDWLTGEYNDTRTVNLLVSSK